MAEARLRDSDVEDGGGRAEAERTRPEGCLKITRGLNEKIESQLETAIRFRAIL